VSQTGQGKIQTQEYPVCGTEGTCGKDVNPGYFATVLCAMQKGIGKQGANRMASNCCQKVGKLWNEEKFGVFSFTTADGKVN